MKTERQNVAVSRASMNGRPDVRARILDALRRKYECEMEELVRDCSSYTWNQIALRRKYECEMEELVRDCSSYTWNQIFLEVDRLSRTGELRLVPRGAGVYAVRLPSA